VYCVSVNATPVCVTDTTPCTTPGATKCFNTATLIHCAAPVTGSDKTYWVEKEDCKKSGKVCDTTASGATCTP
jgi:hypothetical protein